MLVRILRDFRNCPRLVNKCHSIYDLRCARVARAILNVLDLNLGGGCAKLRIAHASKINRSLWLPIVFNFKIPPAPDRLFSSCDRDRPGASTIAKSSSTKVYAGFSKCRLTLCNRCVRSADRHYSNEKQPSTLSTRTLPSVPTISAIMPLVYYKLTFTGGHYYDRSCASVIRVSLVLYNTSKFSRIILFP